MRFCDFFIDYKIGIKDIDKYIKYKELPFLPKNICDNSLYSNTVIDYFSYNPQT